MNIYLFGMPSEDNAIISQGKHEFQLAGGRYSEYAERQLTLAVSMTQGIDRTGRSPGRNPIVFHPKYYFPLNTGLRFSMKASMPSCASPVIMLQAIVSAASW